MKMLRFVVTAIGVNLLAWSLPVSGQQRDNTPAAAAVTGTGEISGRVVSAEANPQPMRRALVTLTGLATPRSVLTDDAGAFSFAALPAGTFTVTARKAAYLAAPFGAKRPGRTGTSIALAAGQRLAITISMSRGAAVSGMLRDATGAPITGIDVRAIDTRLLAAGNDPSTARDVATTDDRGIYRMYGLMPGEYVVVALPSLPGREIGAPSTTEMDTILGALSSRTTSTLTVAAATSAATPVRPVGFAPVFFPGTADVDGASRVRIAAGEEAAGVDFTIAPVPVGTIDGTVTGATGPVEVTFFASGPRIETSFNSASVSGLPIDAQGRFRYMNLAPGRYRIVARSRHGDSTGPVPPSALPIPVAGGGRGGTTPAPLPPGAPAAAVDFLYGFADVEITGGGTVPVAIALQPGGSVSGRIVFTGTGAAAKPEDLSRLRVSMGLDGGGWNITADGGLRMGPSLAGQSYSTIKPDGTFEIRSIGPGRFTLNCTIPADVNKAWVLRSATIGNRDLLDELIDMTSAGDLRNVTITFSDTPTVLNGSLQLPSGQATTDYHMVVMPAERALWRPRSRRIVSVRPATDGRFTFTGLPAGEYLLAAMVDVDPLDLSDAEFLAQLVPAAVKVTVVEGETRTQNLRLSGVSGSGLVFQHRDD